MNSDIEYDSMDDMSDMEFDTADNYDFNVFDVRGRNKRNTGTCYKSKHVRVQEQNKQNSTKKMKKQK
jgi:hypothetical protein